MAWLMSESNKDTQYQTPLAGARQCLSIKTVFINYYIIWNCFFCVDKSINSHSLLYFPDQALSCDTTSLILSGTTLPSSLVPILVPIFAVILTCWLLLMKRWDKNKHGLAAQSHSATSKPAWPSNQHWWHQIQIHVYQTTKNITQFLIFMLLESKFLFNLVHTWIWWIYVHNPIFSLIMWWEDYK